MPVAVRGSVGQRCFLTGILGKGRDWQDLNVNCLHKAEGWVLLGG